VLSTRCAIVVGFCTWLSAAAQQGSIPTFGTTVVIPAGLRGDVYYIPHDATRLPEFQWLKPVGSIYTNSLNVPPQNFRQGFPGVTDRFEWFAIDYNGRFWIEKPGVYQFALTSDDGAKLYIDHELTVDNDGIHPPQVKRASVRLSVGIHRIRVSYFQGPREHVALVLQVAEPGEEWRIFSTDEFKPPPNPENWAYPDADHRTVSSVHGPELRLSSVAGAPGDQVRVEVLFESPPGRELVSLKWEVVVPVQLLEWEGDGPETGGAAAGSGKLVRCSKQKIYSYVCMLAGGRKPIMNGLIAVFHFKIRTDAQPKTTALRVERVEAVTAEGRRSTLNGAEGTVTIH
jgi:hypothetical protein